MRQISVKQAERWLEKLKNENPTAFKEVNKALRKYEKNDNGYECYMKMSHQLLETPFLAKEINAHLQQGNKFIINETEEEKITKLMEYMKTNRLDKFKEIMAMIREISSVRSANLTAQETNKNLIDCLRKIIAGQKDLEDITNTALQTGQQQIASRDLQHLKLNSQLKNKPEEENEDNASHMASRQASNVKVIPQTIDKKTREQHTVQQHVQRHTPKQKSLLIDLKTPMNINEEKKILKYLEKCHGSQLYDNIVKLLHLYQLCIITRNEAIEMVEFIESEDEFECLRDIIESRETDRRKTGAFRPLNDNDFSTLERVSPSYVSIPISYPIKCANRTPELEKLLNDQWISVPHGSEEAFNIRIKNAFQIALLKSEDERYEYDLYSNRLAKASQMLQKAIQILHRNEDLQSEKSKALIDEIVKLGVIQILYRNANKELKQELQWHLKTHQLQTAILFKERLDAQLRELRIIKEVHALKKWVQEAAKNFTKSLDMKSFQFKKGERQKMKGTFFIAELNDRVKILQNGGQQKLFSIPFQEKKPFFSICNSFQCSSKTEHCLSRKPPPVRQYDMKQYKNKTMLPAMILAFEDDSACSHLYSLILFFIDATISSEAERMRARIFLEEVLVRFLGWKMATKRCLSVQFDEDKYHDKLTSIANQNGTQNMDNQVNQVDINHWIFDEDQPSYLKVDLQSHLQEDYQKKVLRFNALQNDPNNHCQYLPAKESNCNILYASQNFYIFIRFLYAIYQRIIRLRQVCQTSEKSLLFDILFYSCVKSREGLKFEQYLNMLFGKQAYLFSSIYKLFENLAKSITIAALCQMTTQSLKYSKLIHSEEIYIMLINRYCLENSMNNSRIIRLNYFTKNNVMYMNSLYSYYKFDDFLRDPSKKRQDIGKNVEIYTLGTFGTIDRKGRENTQMAQENAIEYLFDSANYKMTTVGQKEDMFLYTPRVVDSNIAVDQEIKRLMKISNKIN